MSDELTEKLPADGPDGNNESREQRAARAVGFDASQLAALTPIERVMLVALTELSARLERVETKFTTRLERVETKLDERSRETMPMRDRIDQILAEVLVVKGSVEQVNNRLTLVERNQRDLARDGMRLHEYAMRRLTDFEDRLTQFEEQQQQQQR